MNVSPKGLFQNQVIGSFAKYGHYLLIAVIAMVLVLMIIPLPPLMLDFLIALSMTGALTVLLTAISITDPMKLSSFPTLLLVCTLFRLGLNVSSTRLILARGEAGEIIRTFGEFVTGGNLVVGVVIFFVLLVIQFIVVSKGSERVAEVAARFTLDALPGKQMSIDADLRAGLISSVDAATKRGELLRESKLYGSMDGAMKFVKGDAIAGLIIVFINILGGFAVGVMQHDLDFATALKRYTILTIGDGLVSQIPALLVSISAGFIVTRVSDGTGENSLGAEIGAQIFSQPVTLIVVSIMSLLFAFIPGFPTLLFLIIALAMASFGMLLLWRQRQVTRESYSIDQHRIEDEQSSSQLGHATPLLIELASDMYAKFLVDDRWRGCMNVLFPRLKSALSNQLGIPLPDLKITVNPNLPAEKYTIKIYEIPVDEGLLSPEHCVLKTASIDSSEIEMQGTEKQTETVHGTPVALLHLYRQQELKNRGYKVLAPEDMLLRHLAKMIKANAADFVGIQEVRDILTQVENHHPELVREVVPRMLSIHKLTEIIKRLVDEGVAVKDFRLLLETLSGCHPENKDAVELTELVRMGLRRVITYRYVGMNNRLSCFGLDPDIENEIAKSIQKSGGDHYLTLAPDRIDAISKAVCQTYQNHRLTGRDAVLLTNVEVRRYMRKIIEGELPDVAVLSYQELDPKVAIDQRDTISTLSAEVIAL